MMTKYLVSETAIKAQIRKLSRLFYLLILAGVLIALGVQTVVFLDDPQDGYLLPFVAVPLVAGLLALLLHFRIIPRTKKRMSGGSFIVKPAGIEYTLRDGKILSLPVHEAASITKQQNGWLRIDCKTYQKPFFVPPTDQYIELLKDLRAYGFPEVQEV